jgi:hypothetical protein
MGGPSPPPPLMITRRASDLRSAIPAGRAKHLQFQLQYGGVADRGPLIVEPFSPGQAASGALLVMRETDTALEHHGGGALEAGGSHHGAGGEHRASWWVYVQADDLPLPTQHRACSLVDACLNGIMAYQQCR